jgi:S1-C subfamily serine protease
VRSPAAFLAIPLVVAAPAVASDVLSSLEAEQAELYERVAPGVAVVSAGGALGAGFAVAPGLLLTAAHVVQARGEVEVTLRDGRTLRGTVIERAPNGLDVALVRIPAEPPTLELARSAPLRPGSIVATIGHPDGNRFVLGTGLVAQATGDAADASLVRLQLPLRAGASGGPVVDRSGRVVGIVALGAPGTVTYAVRAEAAVRALSGLSHLAGRAPRAVAPAALAADVVPLAAVPEAPPPPAPRHTAASIVPSVRRARTPRERTEVALISLAGLSLAAAATAAGMALARPPRRRPGR